MSLPAPGVLALARDRVLHAGNYSCRVWLLAPGVWLLAAGLWLLAAKLWLLAAGLWLLAAGFWLLAAALWLLQLGWAGLGCPAQHTGLTAA